MNNIRLIFHICTNCFRAHCS